jgi:hypothetical protein
MELSKPTNAMVLSDALKAFPDLDTEAQEHIADYIACPSTDYCNYDGSNHEVCSTCKAKWLLEDWED